MSQFARKIVTLICLSLTSSTLHATPTLDELLRPLSAEQVEISPGGEKIGVVSHEEGKRVLALMTLDPLEITYVLRFSDGEEVGEFYWVNDERIVSTVIKKRGWMDSPYLSSYLFAVNYNGRQAKTVFGYNVGYSAGQTRSRISGQEAHTAHAEIISILPDDKHQILISTYPWEAKGSYWYFTGETIGEVLKLNVYNGRTKGSISLPTRGGRAWAGDKGEVHFATGHDGDGSSQVYWRHEDEWMQLGNPEIDQVAWPVGYDENETTAYLISYMNSDRSALLAMDLKTGSTQQLYSHPRVDFSDILHVPGTRQPLGVYLDDGLPEVKLLSEAAPAARLIRGLDKAFPGYRVKLESTTRDGTQVIVKVSGDDRPGDFFLLNRKTREIEHLMSAASWLDSESLAKTEAFDFEASDGLLLQGYLTFPNGKKSKLPMVVLPHGGPTARDYWEYDRERQILASAGYLVMTINFRGSSGYGSRFSSLSYGSWGEAVQRDISDATRWAIQQGYANSQRICIYGSSFGAYSAIMNVVREPQLYRCAAGFAGVYDLEMMYKRGDIPKRRAGVAYLKETLGTEKARLQAQSPVHSATKIKVPVFLAHGGEDRRAPIEQAKALEKALRQAGVPVETHYYDEGGHGYYSQDANHKLYSALLKFLNRHLGQSS